MPTRAAPGTDEWYHVYNRGVDKRRTFTAKADLQRFQLLLYLCNNNQPVQVRNLYTRKIADLESDSVYRRQPLVSIASYCIMPNHFHIVAKQIEDNGLSQFMQKLMTGYTMYFNKKYERTGALFAGTYKYKHLAADTYLRQCIAYVHLNPAEIADSEWKHGTALVQKVEKLLSEYTFSSFLDYQNHERAEYAILADDIADFIRELPSPKATIRDAHEYYKTTKV